MKHAILEWLQWSTLAFVVVGGIIAFSTHFSQPTPNVIKSDAPKNMVQEQSPIADEYRLGYSDGWMAYAIDAIAIDRFHREVHSTDKDPNLIWQDCVKDAKQSEDQWNHFTKQQKLDYPIGPFYKSGKGLPRYIK